MASKAGWSTSGTRGDGFAFDNESPRHRVFVAPFELASRPVTARRIRRVHRRRRLPPARAVAFARLGHGGRARLGGAAVLGARRRGVAHVHAARHGRHRRRTRRSATSATSRPMPTRAGPARGCRPSSSGSSRRAAQPIEGNFVEAGALHPLPQRADGSARSRRRCSATSGSGRAATTRPTPASGRPRRRRRVQRQVHVQPVRAARRHLRHAAIAHPRHLSQLLPAGCALAVLGRSPRARSARVEHREIAVAHPASSARVRNPASCSSAVNSAGAYLYEFSVWMRSPARERRARHPAIVTVCAVRASRCISIRPAASLYKRAVRRTRRAGSRCRGGG